MHCKTTWVRAAKNWAFQFSQPKINFNLPENYFVLKYQIVRTTYIYNVLNCVLKTLRGSSIRCKREYNSTMQNLSFYHVKFTCKTLKFFDRQYTDCILGHYLHMLALIYFNIFCISYFTVAQSQLAVHKSEKTILLEGSVRQESPRPQFPRVGQLIPESFPTLVPVTMTSFCFHLLLENPKIRNTQV